MVKLYHSEYDNYNFRGRRFIERDINKVMVLQMSRIISI